MDKSLVLVSPVQYACNIVHMPIWCPNPSLTYRRGGGGYFYADVFTFFSSSFWFGLVKLWFKQSLFLI